MSTRRRTDRTRGRPSLLLLGPAALTVAFFALPLVGLVQRASWATLADDLRSTEALSALRLSVVCSLAAAALSVAFGLPLAWALARVQLPGRSVIRAIVLLPLVLPPVVGGIALSSVFRRHQGLIGQPLYDWFGIQLTYTTWGAILAETFVALPFFVVTAEAGLRSVDQRYEAVAATLGAGRFTTFRRVTLPLAAPSIGAGAVLAWARALGEFGATITFAGNVPGQTQTLPLAVYLFLEGRTDSAIALSLVLLVLSLVVLVTLRDRWLVRS